MAKRKPVLRFDDNNPYEIEEIVLTSGVRLMRPACVPHATIDRAWAERLQRHGWVRVAHIWYGAFMQRAGAVHRARARLKKEQARAYRIGQERAAARAAAAKAETDS